MSLLHEIEKHKDTISGAIVYGNLFYEYCTIFDIFNLRSMLEAFDGPLAFFMAQGFYSKEKDRVKLLSDLSKWLQNGRTSCYLKIIKQY